MSLTTRSTCRMSLATRSISGVSIESKSTWGGLSNEEDLGDVSGNMENLWVSLAMRSTWGCP